MEKRPAWLQNEKMIQCFERLPKSAQVTVMQCSSGFTSAEDLMRFAECFTGNKPQN